uniref:Uncharacterized protein n=1 Tax=Plectus sambesii TaxID=2011161 RepID=A0A914XE24_9BILA
MLRELAKKCNRAMRSSLCVEINFDAPVAWVVKSEPVQNALNAKSEQPSGTQADFPTSEVASSTESSVSTTAEGEDASSTDNSANSVELSVVNNQQNGTDLQPIEEVMQQDSELRTQETIILVQNNGTESAVIVNQTQVQPLLVQAEPQLESSDQPLLETELSLNEIAVEPATTTTTLSPSFVHELIESIVSQQQDLQAATQNQTEKVQQLMETVNSSISLVITEQQQDPAPPKESENEAISSKDLNQNGTVNDLIQAIIEQVQAAQQPEKTSNTLVEANSTVTASSDIPVAQIQVVAVQTQDQTTNSPDPISSEAASTTSVPSTEAAHNDLTTTAFIDLTTQQNIELSDVSTTTVAIPNESSAVVLVNLKNDSSPDVSDVRLNEESIETLQRIVSDYVGDFLNSTLTATTTSDNDANESSTISGASAS